MWPILDGSFMDFSVVSNIVGQTNLELLQLLFKGGKSSLLSMLMIDVSQARS